MGATNNVTSTSLSKITHINLQIRINLSNDLNSLSIIYLRRDTRVFLNAFLQKENLNLKDQKRGAE